MGSSSTLRPAGTVTFVGEVVTTNTFNLPGSSWNMVASAFPATNNLVAMGLAAKGGR